MVQVVIHLDDLGISNDDGNVKLSNEECSSFMCIERTMRLASFKPLLNQPLRPMAAVAAIAPLDASGCACHREAMTTGRRDEPTNSTQPHGGRHRPDAG